MMLVLDKNKTACRVLVRDIRSKSLMCDSQTSNPIVDVKIYGPVFKCI